MRRHQATSRSQRGSWDSRTCSRSCSRRSSTRHIHHSPGYSRGRSFPYNRRRSCHHMSRRSRQRSRSWSRSWSCSCRHSRSRSRRCMTRHSCLVLCTRPNRCEQRKATRLYARGDAGSWRAQTDQLPEQPEAISCRRACSPSIPPVITDSCDERDEALSSNGSTQPWTVESVIARWTSIAYRGPCIDLLRALGQR